MKFEITGYETADELVKQLVALRHSARLLVQRRKYWREKDEIWRQISEHAPDGATKALAIGKLADLGEQYLQIQTAEIEIGRYLVHLCPELDRKVSRDALFDAISTGLAHRDTEDVRKYGDKASHILFVLDLENSSTRDDDTEIRPLKWCHTMAFMNALSTSEKLSRAVHDGANVFFNGIFGEYRERPLTERLIGRAV